MRWGLIPPWAKDPSAGSRLFNARAETVATKPSFRSAFKSRRVIVPADGFYEWHRQNSGAKQPHFFTRSDGAPLALAGVAESWWDKAGRRSDEPTIRSCSIITTTGRPRHGRDPRPHAGDPRSPTPSTGGSTPTTEDTSELTALLRPAPAGTIEHHRRSSPRVGSVRNDDAQLIESVYGPMGPPPRPLDRRTFMAAALAAGGGGLLAVAWAAGAMRGASTIRSAASVEAAGSDLGAIEHVIFFMQENRSFDHYYGTYPGVRGFDDHPAHSLGAFAQAFPDGPATQLLPFHLAARLGHR